MGEATGSLGRTELGVGWGEALHTQQSSMQRPWIYIIVSEHLLCADIGLDTEEGMVSRIIMVVREYLRIKRD